MLQKSSPAPDADEIRPLFLVRGVSSRELLSLRFRDPALEASYWRYALPISLFQSRLSWCIAMPLLLGDYVADGLSFDLGANSANLHRVTVLAPLCLGALLLTFVKSIKQRWELFGSIFFLIIASYLFRVLYVLDGVSEAGISSITGFINFFFILIFGFILIGTRFYYSLASSFVATAVYIVLLFERTGATWQFWYFVYQIATVYILCAVLGYTREFVLRADFATQFEAAEARLAKERSDLQYLDWLKRLAGFLRHEVRQPVAQVNSSLELIQLSATNDPLHKYVTTAFAGIQQVWNLIERASRATDAEAFVREGRPQRVAFEKFLTDLVADFRQTYFGMEIRFTGTGPAWVRVDPVLVKEAIGNLLTNAVSFAEDESAIDVVLESGERDAVLRVRNRGPLIEGDSSELFQPFVSSRSGPSSEHHGLGLYLVRLIVEHYGGSASINNLADGSGVEASLSFPLAA